MTRQEFATNILRSLYDHIDSYLSERDYTDSITIATSKQLLKNRVVSGSDSIEGFTRVSGTPDEGEYKVVNYGAKGNKTNLQFNISDTGTSVSVVYQYKPVLMLAYQEAVNGITNEQVSTPCVWFEIDSDLDQDFDQGKSVVEDIELLSIGLYADVEKNGSFNVSQRDGIKHELKAALSSNIPLKDYSTSPAISTSGIILVDRIAIERSYESGRLGNGMEGSAVLKIKLPDDID